MEYTDDQNASDDETSKSASEKHVISSVIVDALGGQEARATLDPANSLAALAEEFTRSGGAAESVHRVRIGLDKGETDNIAAAKKRRYCLKIFAFVAPVLAVIIVGITFGVDFTDGNGPSSAPTRAPAMTSTTAPFSTPTQTFTPTLAPRWFDCFRN
jgi:hypothetical protein